MKALKLWFLAVLIIMLSVVGWASFSESILSIPSVVSQDPLFIATLFDVYFAFILIYLWIAYRTPSSAGKVLWFILVMGLGNIAIAAYMLIQLWRLPPGSPISALLFKPDNGKC